MARPTTPSKLRTYAAKRDFQSTPEPKPSGKSANGKVSKQGEPSFCVQKHLASALHYDFRLEHDGVLLSWAVPKGPSLNPKDRRMAVRTEDHPLAYGEFEGVIPDGYGAGVVMLWDRGTWTPETSADLPNLASMLEKGEIKFKLSGVKLKGSWVLVRTRGYGGRPGQEAWLLIKHKDRWAGDVDVTEAAPKSVKSFGDLPDIVAASGKLDAVAKRSPTRGGSAGQLLKEVVAAATALKDGAAKPAAGKTTRKPSRASPRKTSPPETLSPATPREASERKAPAKSIPKAALRFGANKPKFTNRTKVLYPAAGFTKGGVIDYYTVVAPLILPQLVGRAATLKRYPDGVKGKFFFEKRCASHRPDWVKTARIALGSREESIDYCLINDLSTLAWAANLAALELHVPLARAANPDEPTMMVFDLDPGPPAGLKECAQVACRLRDLLDHLGLMSFAKTSGNKGLHLMVPLNTPGVTFEQTKPLAHAVASLLQESQPERVTAVMARSMRPGKVFIDWSQNDRSKTTAVAFTLRATPTPNVSWPAEWRDVERGRVKIVRADKPLPVDDYVRQFADRLRLRQRLPDLSESRGTGRGVKRDRFRG